MRFSKIIASITAASVACLCLNAQTGADNDAIFIEASRTTEYTRSGNYTLSYSKVSGGYSVTGLNYSGTELINVVIPSTYEGESVVSIGYGAFSGCSNVSGFTIPDSVTSISGWAFNACNGLTEIVVPNGVTSIGDCVFYNCDNIESIKLPDSVETIGNWAFASCEKLSEIDLPEIATSIGELAFYYCRSLESIEIPEGVTSIGYNAFASCSTLKEVILPDSLTSIGENAFYFCTSLEEIAIPHAVTTISDSAFYYCPSLERVTLGDQITYIGEDAFYHCSSDMIVSGYLNKYTTGVFDERGIVYVEKWNHPTESIISTSSVTVNEGSELKLSIDCADCGENVSRFFTWSSNDTDVVSVSNNGSIFGWRAGKTTIKAECSDPETSIFFEIEVTVNDVSGTISEGGSATLSGTVTDNLLSDNNKMWGYVVDSYICENNDSTLTRVEFYDEIVLVEKYSSDGITLIESKTIIPELPYFGGFFSGSDYNFIVFGQYNMNENDSVEVMRAVKYSKNWERLGSYSLYGGNTTDIFGAGSLRMAETDGNLYIHTCHGMYASSSDGKSHQANMTFVINQSDMTEVQSFYKVGNYEWGYSSHSFNQFISTDGEYIFRVDHGDAYPRAVGITRCKVDGEITDVSYTYALPIPGTTGDNHTGVTVGGFEISSDTCIIAGNSVALDDTYGAVSQRNIFITITDKDLVNTEIKWLTDYSSDDDVSVLPPHLVKIGNDQFLVMWKEVDSGTETTYMVTIDSNGNTTSDIITGDVVLSDCKPVFCTDGLVKWYASDGSKNTLYSVDPFGFESSSDSLFCDSHTIVKHSAKTPTCIESGWNAYESCSECPYTTYVEIPALRHDYEASGSGYICKMCGAYLDIIYGDVNDDGKVNAIDVLLIRKFNAGGWDVTINEDAADVNCDGRVNAIDVLMLRKYIAGGWGVVLGPQA